MSNAPFSPTALVATGPVVLDPLASVMSAPVAADEAPAAVSDAPLPAPAAVEAPKARIVGGPERTKTMLLTYPVEFLGMVYGAIVLSRPTSKQVGEFYEGLRVALKLDPDASVSYPIYFDVNGNPVPDAVLDALDDDDAQRIYEDADAFLPKRLRAPETTDEASSSAPATGEAIAPTSAE